MLTEYSTSTTLLTRLILSIIQRSIPVVTSSNNRCIERGWTKVGVHRLTATFQGWGWISASNQVHKRVNERLAESDSM